MIYSIIKIYQRIIVYPMFNVIRDSIQYANNSAHLKDNKKFQMQQAAKQE